MDIQTKLRTRFQPMINEKKTFSIEFVISIKK